MLVGVVAVITVVVIMSVDVSFPATPGTALTLAHDKAVFTGGQKTTTGAGTASFLLGREGPSQASAQLLIPPHFLPFSWQSGTKAESRFRRVVKAARS